MKEELENIIQNELSKVEASKETESPESQIKKLVNTQNEIITNEKEHRQKLFEILEKLKKMNITLDYNDKMSTKELENIIKEVKI